MSESAKLTWIPFYQEFAQKLLPYKNNRKDLLAIVYSLDSKFTDYIHNDDGSKVGDIDPFSVFAIFNRGLSVANRIKVISYFKDCFNIEAPVPEDFSGIPILNNQQSTLYWRETASEQIPILWDMFEAALTDDESTLAEKFDEIMEYKGIKWNMSIVLFWACPQKFIPLDSVTRNLLKAKHNLTINDEMLSSAKYLGIIGQVKTLFEQPDSPYKSFAEMSDNAFTYASEQQRFWIAGTSFGEPRKNQIDKFVKEGYWEGGECDTEKYIKLVKSGDVLIAATSSTKGSNHDQPFLRIYGVGIVTSDMQVPDPARSHWFKCDVDWIRISPEVDFDGNKYGKYRKTLQECAENLLDLKNFALEKLEMGQIEPRMDEMDKCQEYVKLLEANHNIILHGAPGTGKTYLARQIAASMMFEKSYDKLSENEQSQIGFVQFHPSYDYTDFVEGLRPTKTGSFERTNGIFKDFCVNAQDNFVESGKDEKSYTKDVLVRDLFEKFCLDIERQLLEKESVTLYEKSILRIRQVHRQKDGSAYSIRLAKDAESSTQGLKLAIVERDYQNFKDGKIKSYEDVKPTNDSKSPFHGNAIYYFELYKKLAEFEKKEFGNRQKLDQQEKVTRKNFVFIIDEINRGDMSKIFGELFFAIDPSYRGVRGKIKTQYQNLYEDEDEDYFANGFFVPENVYIIGTMNDIDRSVESMDFAMRRRFVFEEVTAEQSAANFNPPLSAEALKRMSNLNNAIWDDKENKGITGLSSAYHIGPAYFKDFKDGDDKDQFWNRRLKSLLTEYLRGSRNASKDIETLKDAFMGE